MRLVCTHFSPPESALLQTKGLRGASGDATPRGENLYMDMLAACCQNQSANNIGIAQKGQNVKHTVSTTFRPRVFQIALFKGFPNVPPRRLWNT